MARRDQTSFYRTGAIASPFAIRVMRLRVAAGVTPVVHT
jgi:hypothetical protein